MEFVENGIDESIELIEKNKEASLQEEKRNEDVYSFYKILVFSLVCIITVGALTFAVRSFFYSSNSDGDELLSIVVPISNNSTNKGNYHTKYVRNPSLTFGPMPLELIKYRKLINSTLNAIWKDWDIDQYPNFLNMLSVPMLSWNIQKHKYIKLLLENNNNNNNSTKLSHKYVMGYSGSSVTAGHDNYFNESFPFIVSNRLSSIFKSVLNLTVITRNHAIGNNPCYPYDACVHTHMGDDLDFLTWEQVTLLLIIYVYTAYIYNLIYYHGPYSR